MIKLLAQHLEGCTIAQVTQQLAIPRTTVLRILTTLCAEDMTVKRENKYYSGGAIVRVGLQSINGMEIRPIAVPVMCELSAQTRETSQLGILSEDRVLLVEVCNGPNPVRVSSRVGTLAALHCSATGKALMAYGFGEGLRDFLENRQLEKRTPKTTTSAKALIKEAEKIREQGYAIDDEEYFIGVRCLAAPIWNALGEVVAAVGITAPTVNFTKQRVNTIARQVIDAAQKISENMGA